jgi:hypothetical protein
LSLSDSAEIRNRLATLSPGAKIRVRLEDGSELTGTYRGLDGDQVQLEDGTGADVDGVATASIDVGTVDTVLMDVSSTGPE